MLTHYNIERSNSQKESKAPFTFESTLDINGQKMPQGSFLSIKVYVDGSFTLPIRFYCLRQTGELVFCDSNGSIVALWKTHPITDEDTKWITSVLVNEAGVIAGTIATTKQALDIIRGVVNSHTSDFYFPSNAFILMPQCHVAMLAGSAKAIVVTDRDGVRHTFTSDITVQPVADEDEPEAMVFCINGCSYNLRNKYSTVLKRLKHNGICNIVINGSTVDCSQSKLIIKAKMTTEDASNLRVTHNSDGLVLKGVKDA